MIPPTDTIAQRLPREEILKPSLFTWSTLAVGAFLRTLFFFLSDNNGTDALARAALTADWLLHPSLRFVYGDWLPLHFWLMGGLSLVVRNVELACRLLSLLTGIASLFLVWKIAREIYSESAANFSLIVFTLYSLHVGYSTTSSSEAPYLFFVLGGLCSFVIYEHSGQLRWVAICGIGLTSAAAIRYEGWVVIFVMGLLLVSATWRADWHEVWRSKQLSALVLFATTSGSWPIFWMAYSWLKWRQPLHFIVMNHINVANTLAANPTSGVYRLAVFPTALLLALCPLAFVAALYALGLTIRESTGRQLAFVLLALAFVQFYQVVSGGVMAFARYTITLGALLAIMSGYGLERIADRWFSGMKGMFRTVVVGVLVLNLGIILTLSEVQWRYKEKFGSISPRIRFADYIRDVGNHLRNRLGPSDALVIDDYNVQSNIVAAAAGEPLLTDRVFLVSAEKPSRLRSDLDAFIQTKRPKYLVYSDQGTLRPYLYLPRGCPSEALRREIMELKCIFANEVYSVYELTYPGSEPANLEKRELPPTT